MTNLNLAPRLRVRFVLMSAFAVLALLLAACTPATPSAPTTAPAAAAAPTKAPAAASAPTTAPAAAAAPTTAPAAAAAPTTAPAAAAVAKKTFNMGYSVKFLTDPFMALLQDLVLRLAKEQGLTTVAPLNANGDAAKQVTDIHTLVDQGVQGIITVPVDGQAIVPAIQYANSKNVPVVTIDDAPQGGGAYMVVRADNVKMGETSCQSMGKGLGGKGTILELQGDLATPNGLDRTNGFEQCMKANFPGIQVIARPTKWQSEMATNAAQTIVSTTPDLAGIYMESDSVMLAGVLNVLKNNPKVGATGHVFLQAIDGTPLALQKILSDELDATVSQPLDLYGKYGVQYIEDAVNGVKHSLGPTDHGSNFVTFAGNMEDALLAPLVTKANAGDANLWGNIAKATGQ